MAPLNADAAIAKYFVRDPRRTYLDTAAVGIPPLGSGAAVAAFFDGPMQQGIAGRRQWEQKSAGVQARLATLLGLPDATAVQFFANTTHAMNLAALAIDWQAGDEVVLADDDHPSVRHAWSAAERAGANVIAVPMPVDQEMRREQRLVAQLTPRTKVLAVSQVHSTTGHWLDLARLRAACDQHGCLLAVDGIQALGAVPVNAGLADIYCAASFKWLLSGFGLGLLTLSEAARGHMTPPFRGYKNVPPSTELRYSHWNYPGLYALDHGLDVFDAIGWPAVHAHVQALAGELLQRLAALHFEVLTPAAAHAGIVSIRTASGAWFKQQLQLRGIDVAARDGVLRISPHIYNRLSDIELVTQTLEELRDEVAE